VYNSFAGTNKSFIIFIRTPHETITTPTAAARLWPYRRRRRRRRDKGEIDV